MNRFSALVLAPLACSAVLTATGPATADEIDEARLKELVYEAIRENPEIIREAVVLLEAADQAAQAEAAAQALADAREIIENDPNAPVLGNPDGDVTVVEFFDYNCSYCRRVYPNITALLQTDKNIRVVMREWPILGEESVYAARASLAARNQDKYEEFHKALMGGRGRANEAAVINLAENLGMDIEKLRSDMDSPEVAAHLETSQRLTRALGFNGTPAFVIGDQIVPGAIELDRMRALIEDARG